MRKSLTTTVLLICFLQVSAQLQFEYFDLGLNEVHSAFLDSGDNIVLSSDSGYIIYSDSIQIDYLNKQIFGPIDPRVFEGNSGNIIWASRFCDFYTWKNGTLDSLKIDNSIPSNFNCTRPIIRAKEIGLDKYLIAYDRSPHLILLENDSASYIHFQPDRPLDPVRSPNFIEIEPNKYFTKYAGDSMMIYNASSGQLQFIADSVLGLAGEAVRTYSVGQSNEYYAISSVSIYTMQGSSIIKKTDLSDFGVVGNFNSYYSAIHPQTGDFYVSSGETLIVFDGDSVVQYDDADNFYVSIIPFPSGPFASVIGLDFDSQGNLYLMNDLGEVLVYTSFTTSLNNPENKEKLVKFYPVPLKDHQLQIRTEMDIKWLKMVDLQGKTIQVFSETELIQKLLNIKTNIPNGVYFIKGHSISYGPISQKLILE